MTRAVESNAGRRRRRQRGMTLIEVLVSFFILFVISLAVLELFSLSVAVNLGSQARSQLTYRAQLVAETVRLHSFLARLPTATNSACCPIAPGNYDLPQSGCENFWGPNGVNAWWPEAPYLLNVQIAAAGNGRRVTVTAFPRAAESGGQRVLFRTVKYVAEI